MNRYLLLFLLAFAGLLSGTFLPALSFFTPLSLAILLFGGLGLWKLDRHALRELGFPQGTAGLRQLPLAIGVGLMLVLLLTGILFLTGSLSISLGQSSGRSLLPLIFYTFVWTALIAASEELIFRGIFLQVIDAQTSPLAAAASTAGLWAAFHLPAMSADDVPLLLMMLGMLTFLAFGIGLAFSKALAAGALWVPIGIHYGYNLGFSTLGAFFTIDVAGAPLLTGAPGWIPESGLIGVAVLTAFAIIVLTRIRKPIRFDGRELSSNSTAK